MTDVAPAPVEEFPNRVGKVAVTVTCPGCSVSDTIYVPEGTKDPTMTFEHACADGSVVKGTWVNPDGVKAATDPEGDVIWDPEHRVYVPRVKVPVAEAGAAAEASVAS